MWRETKTSHQEPKEPDSHVEGSVYQKPGSVFPGPQETLDDWTPDDTFMQPHERLWATITQSSPS